MKAHAVFVVVFLSCLFVPFVHADTPKAVIGLTATMELDKGDDGEYDSDPITLTYTLKNESTKSVYVLRWGTPLERFMSNFLDIRPMDEGLSTDPRSVKRKKVAYNGYLVSRIGPLPEDYVEIPAGKSISVKLPVHEGYQIQETGKYSISMPRKTVLDAVHVKPAAGEVIKRKFVSAPVQLTKKELKFNQKTKRPWKPLPPGQPGAPGPPAPSLNAPGNIRTINKAPQPIYRSRLSSGTIEYADYSIPPPSLEDSTEEKLSFHKEITGPDKEKLMESYYKAFKLAAQTKVILNAGESAIIETKRFASWFGKSGQTSGASSPEGCDKLSDTANEDLRSNERFNRVCSSFGKIYSRFFESDEGRKIRFFHGTRKYKSNPLLDGEHEDALKDAYPCDYGSVVAYVWATEEKPIMFLCDSFFRPPAGDSVDQPGVIIHELSHKAGVLGDRAYQQKECLDLASCAPDEALDNADNYHFFASNPTNLEVGLGQGQWYANFGTLDGFYLSASTAGKLNAQRKDSSDCGNCNFVLEALGSTATAAPLKDGQTVRLLTSGRQSVVSAAGDIVQTDSPRQKDFSIRKKSGGENTAGGEIITGDEIYLEPVTGGARLNVTTGSGNKSDVFIIELAR